MRRLALPLAAALFRNRIVCIFSILEAKRCICSWWLAGPGALLDLPLSLQHDGVARVPKEDRAVRTQVADLRSVTLGKTHARGAIEELAGLRHAHLRGVNRSVFSEPAWRLSVRARNARECDYNDRNA